MYEYGCWDCNGADEIITWAELEKEEECEYELRKMYSKQSEEIRNKILNKN